ncbi:Septum site-determining protein DivIVA [bacterium HR15]|nr:Septum site-determining protein DivIVA [bacterium HR15]
MNEAKRLTVLEIETKKFRRRLRGYDPVAVDAFLQEVAAHYEEVLTENHQLREELIGLREEVQRYRTLENTLKESLVLAQKSADETRANAHREAELIMREARLQADQVRREAEARVQQLMREIESLEARKRAVILELRALLLAHLQALEPIEVDIQHAAAESPTEQAQEQVQQV